MASGVDRYTGKPLSGWPYTIQQLEKIAVEQIGVRVMREYVGSINPGLLARQNLTEEALDRWTYALIIAWRLWAPMYRVTGWQYVTTGEERSGVGGIKFIGAHMPDAHLGDYAAEGQRQIRADLSSQYIRILG